MAHDEFSFLFNASLTDQTGIDNRSNKGSIFGEVPSPYYVPFKDPTSTDVKNWISTKVDADNGDLNPFIKLIGDFSSKSSMQLLPADFAYLTKLGVYPLNRLIILRRFAEGVVVTNNLSKMPANIKPISTVIGFINVDQEHSFDLTFNENWTTSTKQIYEVIGDILNNEFGINASKLIPIPGWSQALLFGFLNAMGVTKDFSWDSIPAGNPNVLQQGATRDSESFGLVSTLPLTLKTSYEQKYINDVDPGMAMMDIIQNLLSMGTSDVKYIFSAGSPVLQKLRTAAYNGNNSADWFNFITEFISDFVKAISSIVGEVANTLSKFSFSTETNKPGTEQKTSDTSAAVSGAKNIAGGIEHAILNVGGNSLIRSILTSTVMKYRWPLIGSLGASTGENTTPWHLTIGNPYSPIISVGNIIVESVNVKGSNEFSYNDMPTKIDVDITMKLGRNLGGQEIYQMFNQSYFRVYSVDNQKNPVPATASSRILGNPKVGINNTSVTTSNENQSTTATKSYIGPPNYTPDTIPSSTSNNNTLNEGTSIGSSNSPLGGGLAGGLR